MRKRVLVMLAVGVLVVAGLAGGGWAYLRAHHVDETADVLDAAVTVADGGTVRLHGATLTVPPAAVSADGHLTARSANPPPALGTVEPHSPLRVTAASAAVEFGITGATLTRPVSVTITVDPAAFPPDAATAANQHDGAWIATFDAATNAWRPVAGDYDPGRRTVTAQVDHLSWWAAETWDWTGALTRLRQSLSADDSGRAAPSTCTNAPGTTVTIAHSEDPPIQGCATLAGDSVLDVSITSNRGYSMVLTAPGGANAGPPTYVGFEEFERNTAAVRQALGGAYLAPTHTLTYTLPLYGKPVTFDATISVKTLVLDQALAAASAIFGAATGGYSDCILDQVARSGPAPLSDAPGMIIECFPVLAQASAIYRFYEDHIEPLENLTRDVLAGYDQAHDSLLGIHGTVQITRPSAPPAELFVDTPFTSGLFTPPNFPAEIGIDNHDSLLGLTWGYSTPAQATATGQLSLNDCTPDCADGHQHTYPAKVLATAPTNCTIGRPIGSSHGGYAYSKITVTATSGNPDPTYVGDYLSPQCE